MRIATFNINNINSRLANLLGWLESTRPDVVVLQELKCTDDKFPVAPVLIRKELPGDASDRHARYIEAAVGGVVIASLYAPNGNPQPGPKFDDKLDWMDRLIDHAAPAARRCAGGAGRRRQCRADGLRHLRHAMQGCGWTICC